MDETNQTPETPMTQPRVIPAHWRKTFAVPLKAEEKQILAEAAARDGKPLATWIREAALALAQSLQD